MVKIVDPLQVNNGEFLWGVVDEANREIRLSNSMCHEVMCRTFLHEVLHICDSQVKPIPEHRIDDMSRRLYDFLINNKIFKEGI